MRKTTIAALALASTSVLAVPATAVASGHVQQGQTKCKNDGHKYINGMTATAHGKKTTFTGKLMRFHPCGEDDGYFTGKTPLSITLTKATTITVFKVSEDPSTTKTVTAAKFPHAFKKNSDEPFYQWSGPKSAVKKMSEHFVS